MKSFLPSLALCVSICLLAQAPQADQMGVLSLKAKTLLDAPSPLSGAVYQKAGGPEMIRHGGFSPDNGRTWEPVPATPDFDTGLPYGYRRNPHTPWRDPVNGNIMTLLNCMDTPDKDPRIDEPEWAWYWYYLRYRVSTDGGRTWLFDEPIVQDGADFSPQHPINGVHIGKNCFFLGDSGCQPIRTREGAILVPAQMPPLNANGEGFYNPGGGWYWLDSIVLIGQWKEDGRIAWSLSDPIKGDGDRTARGLYEPTLAQLPDGRILCVMRGSNGGPRDPEFKWPSCKWASMSTDGGHTWSKPEPWTYSDGKPFFSPASMSQLFTHSNGRIYWIGNLSEANCQANHPRWPLVIGELDPATGRLIRDSLLAIDTKQPDEDDVNLSHWHVFEDRQTGDIVIPTARAGKDYKTSRPVVYVIGVNSAS